MPHRLQSRSAAWADQGCYTVKHRPPVPLSDRSEPFFEEGFGVIAALVLDKSEEDGHKLLHHVAIEVELGKPIGDTHLIMEIGGGITWGGSQSPMMPPMPPWEDGAA